MISRPVIPICDHQQAHVAPRPPVATLATAAKGGLRSPAISRSPAPRFLSSAAAAHFALTQTSFLLTTTLSHHPVATANHQVRCAAGSVHHRHAQDSEEARERERQGDLEEGQGRERLTGGPRHRPVTRNGGQLGGNPLCDANILKQNMTQMRHPPRRERPPRAAASLLILNLAAAEFAVLQYQARLLCPPW